MSQLKMHIRRLLCLEALRLRRARLAAEPEERELIDLMLRRLRERISKVNAR